MSHQSEKLFTKDELNRLQNFGIISDLVVTDIDIWEGDRERARQWLKDNPKSNACPDSI